jgi:hypothetical protein
VVELRLLVPDACPALRLWRAESRQSGIERQAATRRRAYLTFAEPGQASWQSGMGGNYEMFIRIPRRL